jgi:hypothetical protein
VLCLLKWAVNEKNPSKYDKFSNCQLMTQCMLSVFVRATDIRVLKSLVWFGDIAMLDIR